MFLLIFGGNLLTLYGPSFLAVGRWPLILLVIGSIINLLTGPHGAMLNMLGHERNLFKIYLISSIMFLLGLFVLGPKFGLIGIAVASLLPNVFLNFIELYFMKKWLGIGWWSVRYKRLINPIIATILVALSINWFSPVYVAWELASILILLYAIFALTYLLKGLSAEDTEITNIICSQLCFRSKNN
jgi:O-antigen/teichoic acid export membrane protein